MKRFIGAWLWPVLLGSRLCTAQVANQGTPGCSIPDLKLFEAATSLSNTLTSWSFVMIGGSILAIIGTSYYRPRATLVRVGYLAFAPAWFCLSWSVYEGTRVQGVYLAALFQQRPQLIQLRAALNQDALAQINWMGCGLLFFVVWLVIYLFWWVFNNEPKTERTT